MDCRPAFQILHVMECTGLSSERRSGEVAGLALKNQLEVVLATPRAHHTVLRVTLSPQLMVVSTKVTEDNFYWGGCRVNDYGELEIPHIYG